LIVNKITSYLSDEILDSLANIFEIYLPKELRREKSLVTSEYINDKEQLQFLKTLWLNLANIGIL
jgi:hypothetical protein